jgi:hypothetical protein
MEFESLPQIITCAKSYLSIAVLPCICPIHVSLLHTSDNAVSICPISTKGSEQIGPVEKSTRLTSSVRYFFCLLSLDSHSHLSMSVYVRSYIWASRLLHQNLPQSLVHFVRNITILLLQISSGSKNWHRFSPIRA